MGSGGGKGRDKKIKRQKGELKVEQRGGGPRGMSNSFIHSLDMHGYLFRECACRKRLLPSRNSHASEDVDNKPMNKWTNKMISESATS